MLVEEYKEEMKEKRIMKARLTKGTTEYVNEEIIPKLAPGEYEVLKKLGKALREEALKEE